MARCAPAERTNKPFVRSSTNDVRRQNESAAKAATVPPRRNAFHAHMDVALFEVSNGDSGRARNF